MTIALVVVVKNTKNVMVNPLKAIVCLVICFLALHTKAQVTLNIDEKIEEKLRIKNAQIDSTKLSGYRIQIASSSSRSVTNAAKTKFKNRFPEYGDRVYSLYQQPNWKIRVGDFRREIDAQKMLKEVRAHFKLAILVTGNIRQPMIE